MAEFTRETALVEEVYIRVPKKSGDDRYLTRPYNLVTYDDGQQYVEPVSVQVVPFPYTYFELTPTSTASKFLIVDVAPYVGVTEIR